MMSIINILDSSIFNRIAAGEVVDKPLSIVKELTENSIDAQSTSIIIDVKNGGIDFIRVTDNGKGLSKDDLFNAFLPHATSKIKNIQDLDSIATLGFRGEALPSIASVSKVTMTSRQENSDLGFFVTYENGKLIDSGEVGSPLGTSVTVEKLFENIPARQKFLKKPKLEEADISDFVSKLILANFNVSIKYTANDKKIYHSNGNGKEAAVYTVYGMDCLKNLTYIDSKYIESDNTMSDIILSGYVNKPAFSKHNRTFQTLIVNGRIVTNSAISYAVFQCFSGYLMQHQFPMYILYLNIPFDMVDVNVHPNKMEVKFASPQIVNKIITDTISRKILELSFSAKEITSSITNTEDEPIRSERASTYSLTKNNDKPNILNSYKIKSSMQNMISGNLTEPTKFSHILNDLFGAASQITATRDPLIKQPDNQNQQLDKSFDKKLISTDECFSFSKNSELNLNVIGKAFNTYIIVQSNDDLFFIDQHAAHEKLIYDRLISEIDNNSIIIQDLLAPYVFELSNIEEEQLLSKIEVLETFGFSISNMGNRIFKLNSIPLQLNDMEFKEFVFNLMSTIKSGEVKNSNFLKERVMQAACKAAVKGDMDLSKFEISSLLELMRKKDTPLFCPHGRPIVVKIARSEIEKWFKRKL